MKLKWIALALGAVAIGSSGLAQGALANDPVGVWRTISDVDGEPRALVRLSATNGEVRGVVVGTLREGESPNRVCDRCSGARRNQPIVGMTILWGLRRDPADPTQFTNGSVLDPETGDIYNARLRISPDGQSLQLRGYLMVSLLGRSQTWQRAS